MTTPCEAHIDVFRVAKTVHFPASRHRDVAPGRVVEVGDIEVVRTLVGIFHPAEFPYTVERKEILRLGLCAPVSEKESILIRIK